MKSFFIGKHVPYIPPLFENNEYIEDLKKKAELFNSLTVNIHQLCLTKHMKGYPNLKLPLMTYLK